MSTPLLATKLYIPPHRPNVVLRARLIARLNEGLHRYRWRVAMARIKQAQGDLEAALALLEEARRRYVGDFFPNVRPIAALVARL